MNAEQIAELRQALANCVRAIDKMNGYDFVVRELARAGLSQELSQCVHSGVGILDATAV